MLTLNREAGQSIFLGRRLILSDLPGSCEYQIDFDVVDHRVGHRRIEVLLGDQFNFARHILTPHQPDLDFAPEMRLAFISTREYMRDDICTAVARVGIRAPRNISICRDDARAVIGAVR